MQNRPLMLLLMLPLAIAIPTRITTLERCYNTTIVKVTGPNETIDQKIKVINFTFNEEKQWWEYLCNGSGLPIYIDTENENKNIYNAVVQYYVEALLPTQNTTLPSVEQITNEAYKRIETYTNIEIKYIPEPEPTLGEMTEDNMIFIGILIVFGTIMLIAFVSYIYTIFMSPEEDDFMVRKKRKELENEDIEEELRHLAGLK